MIIKFRYIRNIIILILFFSVFNFNNAIGAEFYVDPDFTGVSLGTASAPWSKLDAASSSSAWETINAALSTSDVFIYFSARASNVDADQTTSTRISIMRTDTSSHRLTLDGMSKYNGNDSKPVWYEYNGKSRYSISRDGYCIESSSRGWVKQNYVTVRGFKARTTSWTRSQAFYYWGGDHIVIENNDFSGSRMEASASCVLFGYAHLQDESKVNGNGGCTDIKFLNNTVHDTMGEGLYIGGSDDTGLPAHSYVTLENNTIYNTGIYGGEGDCIDLKDGLTNVTVKRNILHDNFGANAQGISSHSPVTVEQNVLYNLANTGITFNTFLGRGYTGVTILNNLIFNCGSDAIAFGSKDVSRVISMILIDHNTFYANKGSGILGSGKEGSINQCYVKNNNIINNANYGISAWGFTIASSYNNIYGNTYRVVNCTELKNYSLNPSFVNPSNPAGPDNIFWSQDDGFFLSTNSPILSSSETGGVIGIYYTTKSETTPPIDLRVLPR